MFPFNHHHHRCLHLIASYTFIIFVIYHFLHHHHSVENNKYYKDNFHTDTQGPFNQNCSKLISSNHHFGWTVWSDRSTTAAASFFRLLHSASIIFSLFFSFSIYMSLSYSYIDCIIDISTFDSQSKFKHILYNL